MSGGILSGSADGSVHVADVPLNKPGALADAVKQQQQQQQVQHVALPRSSEKQEGPSEQDPIPIRPAETGKWT
jgi:hypothetical protein